MDAERGHFRAHHFRYALKRELATAIICDAGHGDHAAHRGDVDDETTASRTKPRKKCLGNRNRAEDVHVELPAHLFDWQLLKYPLVAVTGIIDQHINRSMLVLRLSDDIRYAVELCYVAEDWP